MEDQFLYAELIPSIILIIIALACAEFIGRNKHIGFNYTLFMMLAIIPGIIALIFSPSVNKPPTKPNNIYLVFCILFGLFSAYQLYSIQGANDTPIHKFMIITSFIATTFYFYDLSYGSIVNKNPKNYFGTNEVIKQEVKPLSKIESLNNLKAKGILSEEEYMEKAKIVNLEIAEKRLKETEEYKQLQNLLNSQLLTHDEFENKVNILRQNL